MTLLAVKNLPLVLPPAEVPWAFLRKLLSKRRKDWPSLFETTVRHETRGLFFTCLCSLVDLFWLLSCALHPEVATSTRTCFSIINCRRSMSFSPSIHDLACVFDV